MPQLGVVILYYLHDVREASASSKEWRSGRVSEKQPSKWTKQVYSTSCDSESEQNNILPQWRCRDWTIAVPKK